MQHWNTYAEGHLPAPLKKDLEQLKQELKHNGFLDPDRYTGWSNGLQLAALFTASILITFFFSHSLAAFFISTLLLGLFYLRMAFFAHDLIHGQLIRGGKAGKFLMYAMVSFSQGLSAIWWRKKHGTHHHYPNAYQMQPQAQGGEAPRPLDGDIDTLPLICWSRSLLTEAQQKSPLMQWWLKVQCYAFWPIICTLRFAWIVASWKSADALERTLMLVHHSAIVIIGTALFSITHEFSSALLLSFLWLLIANFIGGAILGVFALISHSGMQVYEHEKGAALDPYASVFKSTRNVKANALIFWLSGGLSHQIEHHLFATLKRQHLLSTSAKVKELVQRHGFAYEEVGFFRALQILHRSLKV